MATSQAPQSEADDIDTRPPRLPEGDWINPQFRRGLLEAVRKRSAGYRWKRELDPEALVALRDMLVFEKYPSLKAALELLAQI